MTRALILFFYFAATGTFFLASCGVKGDLYRADPEKPNPGGA